MAGKSQVLMYWVTSWFLCLNWTRRILLSFSCHFEVFSASLPDLTTTPTSTSMNSLHLCFSISTSTFSNIYTRIHPRFASHDHSLLHLDSRLVSQERISLERRLPRAGSRVTIPLENTPWGTGSRKLLLKIIRTDCIQVHSHTNL